MKRTRRNAIYTISVCMTSLAGCTSGPSNEASTQDETTDSQDETSSSECEGGSGNSLRIVPGGITVLIEGQHDKETIYDSIDIQERNIDIQQISESSTGIYVTITAYELTEGDVQTLFNRAENLNVQNIRSGVHPGLVNRITDGINERVQMSNEISNQDIQYTDEVSNGEQKIYATSSEYISEIMPLINQTRIISQIGDSSKELLNKDDFDIDNGLSIRPSGGAWTITMNLNDQGKNKFANEIEEFYSEESRDHIQFEINGEAVGRYRVTDGLAQSVTGNNWDRELRLFVQTEDLKNHINLPLLKMNMDIISC